MFTVQLQSGCDFCNYELKLILVAKIATESYSYHWLLFLHPVVEVTFGCLFCNRYLQFGLDSKISTNSCNNLFLIFPVFYTPVILFFTASNNRKWLIAIFLSSEENISCNVFHSSFVFYCNHEISVIYCNQILLNNLFVIKIFVAFHLLFNNCI